MVDELVCCATGSITRSWTIGGGSIGRRSADKVDVKNESDEALHSQLLTFATHTTHPSLLGLLPYNEFINPASSGIIGVDNMASIILGDSGMHWKKRRSSALFRNFDEAYGVQ